MVVSAGYRRRRRGVGGFDALLTQEGLLSVWVAKDTEGQVLPDRKGIYPAQLGSTAGVDAADPTLTADGLRFQSDFCTVASQNLGDLTFHALFRLNANTAADFAALSLGGAAGSSSVFFGIGTRQITVGNHALWGFVSGEGNIVGPTTFGTGVWLVATIVHPGSFVANGNKIYLNGVLEAQLNGGLVSALATPFFNFCVNANDATCKAWSVHTIMENQAQIDKDVAAYLSLL